MTLITGQVSDVGMNNASGVFYARAAEFRGDGTTVVSTAPATFAITDGALSADIAPGPTIITLHVGPIRKDWFVNVPETDVGLGDLIATYTTYEPAVVSAAIAARDAAIEAESEAKQAAIDAEAKRVAAETAADLTGQDRLHVDNVRALLDETYDQSQAGMALPPRLTETALNATYRPIFGVSADYVNDASLDATAHVQARMDAAAAAGGGEVYVTGALRIDGTLIVPGKVTIHLAQGAQLVRYAAHSTSTAPVVVIGSGYGRLVGESTKGSMVVSEVPTPEGVVLLGHSDYAPLVSVQHAAILRVGIRGHAQGGNTTGEATVALKVSSRQELATNASRVVYFNEIDGVACEYANHGVLMQGWVNANYVDNLFLNQVGNGERLGGGGVTLRSFNDSRPLDLIIGKVFHHGSGGAATLRVETNISLSNIGPLVSEPGGASRLVRLTGTAEQSTGVRLSGISNNAGGFGVTDPFRANNAVAINGEESVQRLTVLGDAAVGGPLSAAAITAGGGRLADTSFGSATTSQVPENSERAVAAVTVGHGTHYHCMIEMDVEISFGVTQTRHARAEFLARSTPTGVTVVTLPSPATVAFIVEPVVAGQVVTLGVKTPNSGTGATATISARVRAHSYRATVQMLDPATATIASTNLVPAGVGGLGAVTSGAPSSATKKVQLFDAAGVSVGFIAVSDS